MAEETNVQKLAREREEKQRLLELEKKSFTMDKISEMTSFSVDMLQVFQRTVAKNTSPAELVYFLTVCKQVGLNPINKEIWCYKDNIGNLVVFTGRDGFLKKNKENPNYLGMRSSEVCQFDEFEIDMIEGSVRHKITNNRGNVIGAYAIVSIRGQKDTIVYLDFDEFNLGQAKWKTAPKMMIKKCAQSHALKEAAGITGIQAEESFTVINNVAVSKGDDVSRDLSAEKEEERLIALIQNCETKESLEKLKKECLTPESSIAYDEKMKTFN